MSLLHSIENNKDTQSFLEENSGKLQSQCERVMELLYTGKRLSERDLVIDYGMNGGGRRLRECKAARPNIINKEWKKDANGKRLYMEYWIDCPKIQTKSDVVRKATALIENMKSIGQQQALF